MKRIVVTQRIDKTLEYDEMRESLDQNLTRFISVAGGISFPISNLLIIENTLNEFLNLINPHGIVLSGGADISINIERDNTEYALLSYAKEKKIPVLGICRGMQIMSIFEGILLKEVRHHIKKNHFIYGDINMIVNSFHKYSIIRCPDDYVIKAQSLDGEIEAFRHKYLPWEGWMWHPERESPFSNNDLTGFKNLFKM